MDLPECKVIGNKLFMDFGIAEQSKIKLINIVDKLCTNTTNNLC